MQKEYPLIPLFEQFVREIYSGKRLKQNGDRIKKSSAINYEQMLSLLKEFENSWKFNLRIRVINKGSIRQFLIEKNYWKRFYLKFNQFLYHDKGCFDNYAGTTMKIMRTFLIYLGKEKLLAIGEFHKQLYVRSEEVEIITLLPERFRFLIQNKLFDESLPAFLKRTKDFFVFGCTVALRFSDLRNIRVRDIFKADDVYYLFVRSLKTESVSRIKLPHYAIEILVRYGINKKKSGQNFRNCMPPAV